MKKIDFQALPKTLYGFYWMVAKRFGVFFLFLAVIALARTVISIVSNPIWSKLIFSLFEKPLNPDNWWAISYPILTILLTISLVRFSLSVISEYVQRKRNPIINEWRREQLFNYIYKQDWMFFANNSAGKINSQIGKVADNFYNLFFNVLVDNTGIFIGILINVGLMLYINPLIAAVCFGTIFVKIFNMLLFRKKLSAASAEASKLNSKFAGIKTDSLENFNSIKIFSGEKMESDVVHSNRIAAIKAQWKVDYIKRWINLPFDLVDWMVDVVLYAILVYMFAKGLVKVSDVAMITSAFYNIYDRMLRIVNALPNLIETYSDAKQAYKEIKIPQNVNDIPGARPLGIKVGAVQFKNVSFKYKNGAKVLNKLNLKISGGEKIGIVGSSGEGKTTIVHLLLRLFDVSGGAILIDGEDIKNVRQDSLRDNISFVPQDNKLFNRTIFENIKYGRWDAKKSEVIAAAKQANIHDFIMKTKKKYETLVGNNGIKLSGGQRQRIAIARAILRDAPILIFDEATSALDSENEIAIQKSLFQLMKSRTSIIIAHRLSTLRKMDRIVVIDGGRIAESGTHSELLAKKNGIYARMWKSQSGEFL